MEKVPRCRMIQPFHSLKSTRLFVPFWIHNLIFISIFTFFPEFFHVIVLFINPNLPFFHKSTLLNFSIQIYFSNFKIKWGNISRGKIVLFLLAATSFIVG